MNLPPEYENSPFVKEPMSDNEELLLEEYYRAVANGETNNYKLTEPEAN